MVTIDPERHELQAVLERLPSAPGRVLEIGCGDGRLTRRYSARVRSILAIDPDASLIAAFRAAGLDSNVEVRATGIDGLTFPDGSFDAVLFSWAL
jgi:ubiquinone/menaquinone biosynthesis C-methylase UbiE